MSSPDPNALAAQIKRPTERPVETWNPPLSGTLDMRIARNGCWYYQGTPIQRERLIALFASILRCDDDDEYYLVTPIEKWRIQVDDVPFIATMLDVSGEHQQRQLTFTTNVGDRVIGGAEHALTVHYEYPDAEPRPYIHIRGRLRALISRSVFVQLADYAEPGDVHGQPCYGVWSQNVFFFLGPLT